MSWIDQDDSEEKVKSVIQAATGYWLGHEPWQGWGGETERLNQIAREFDLPELYHGEPGGQARSKINSIIGGLGIPAEASMYLDFRTGRHFGAQPELARLTNAWDYNDEGVLTEFGPNVLRRNSQGALLERGTTNHVLWSRDLSNSAWITGNGMEVEAVPDARFGSINRLKSTTSNNISWIYQTNVSASFSGPACLCVIARAVQTEVNGLVWFATQAAGSGTVSRLYLDPVTLIISGATNNVIDSDSVDLGDGLRLIYFSHPNDETVSKGLYLRDTGTDIKNFLDVAAAWCEPGIRPSSFIETGGAQASRAADLLTVPVQDGGRAFVFEFDYLGGNPGTGSLVLYGSNTSNRLGLGVNSAGALYIDRFAGGSGGSAALAGGSLPLGRNVVAGVLSSDGSRYHRIGNPVSTWSASDALLPTFQNMGLGCFPWSTSSNAPIRARRFVEASYSNFANRNEAFNWSEAIAQEWAA